MNRRLLVLSSILAALLCVAVAVFLYSLYAAPERKTAVEDSRRDVLCAVPTDAVAIFHFSDLNEMRSRFFDGASSPLPALSPQDEPRIGNLLREVPELDRAARKQSLVSVHYESKNQVSWLWVQALPESLDREALENSLLRICSGVNRKRYNGVDVIRSVSPDLSFAVYGNYLLVSPAIVVLESSIRHLDGHSSILDDSSFVGATAFASGNASLYLNHNNIGKLYSGLLSPSRLQTASFASSLSGWTVMELQSDASSVDVAGRFWTDGEEGRYLSLLEGDKGRVSGILPLLPYNTHWTLLLSPTDFSRYLDGFGTYIGARKKTKDYAYLNALAPKRIDCKTGTREWFLSLDPEEVGVAEIPVGKKSERIVLLHCGNPAAAGVPEAPRKGESLADIVSDTVGFAWKGYLPALLGSFFSATSEEVACRFGPAVLIGSRSAVSALLEAVRGDVYFTLAEYLSQTRAGFVCKGPSPLTLTVNLARCTGQVRDLLKKQTGAALAGRLAERNLAFLSASFSAADRGLAMKGQLLFEQTAELPVPPRNKSRDEEPVYVDDTPVDVPSGPFPVRNFINGKQNWLTQYDNNAIAYLDHNRKAMWSIPFKDRIAGRVEQIDYFRNGKLQMSFAGGSRLCLLDRLGRWVSPFPVDLGRKVLLGPLVYDKTGQGDFRFLLLHTDNRLALYNETGRPAAGWNEITVSEKIRELPERKKVGSERYWILRTSYRMLLYDALGRPVADFSGRHELRPDSKCVVHSPEEVVVTTKDGKDMILNLKKGTFKRY